VAKQDGVLPDHKKVKKRLIPPLLQALGDKHAPYSWTRQIVPEVFWIWMLTRKFGFQQGGYLASAIGKAAAASTQENPKPLFSKNSSFNNLSAEEQQTARNMLSPEVIKQANVALSSYFDLFPKSSIKFLFDGQSSTKDALRETGEALAEIYDRYGRGAALTLANANRMAIEQNKLKVFSNLSHKVREDFENIEDYPNTERSKLAASAFRAGAPLLLMMSEEGLGHDDGWLKTFWDAVGDMGECETSFPETEDETFAEDDFISKVVFSYRNAVREELSYRIKIWN
jgi:hypothetical protein